MLAYVNEPEYDSQLKINELIWPQDRIDHLAAHGVTAEEVGQVCFGNPLVERAKSEGPSPVYYVRGQSDSGRYLFSRYYRAARWQGISGDGAPHDRLTRSRN